MAGGITTTPNKRSSQPWRAGLNAKRVPWPARVDPNLFVDSQAIKVAVTANAAINAVSLTVTALTDAIPAGTQLRFAAGKYAYTSAAAAKGATAVPVEAIPVAIANGDVAYYKTRKEVHIPGGTAIGRTIAERDAKAAFGPAVNTDDEIYLIMEDIPDASRDANCSLLANGEMVRENYLPDWTNWAALLKTAIRTKYQCTIGETS
jgi:hypothetical protein